MSSDKMAERDLGMEAVSATQAAALAASVLMGRHNPQSANAAAVGAMGSAIDGLEVDATVVLGEGAEGVALSLYNGQKLGNDGGRKMDLALDALDGATSLSRGGMNSISFLVMAEPGGIMNVPDVYMQKIAVGPGLPKDVFDLDSPPEVNVAAVAKAKGVDIGDLVVCMLDRPRHSLMFQKVINAGARTIALASGDISAILATADPASGIDIYMGTGGGPEGVLAAAALGCIGGQMQAKLLFRNDDERAIAAAWNITDLDRRYDVESLAPGALAFAATGVTNGVLLRGVGRSNGERISHSVIADRKDGTLRPMTAHHHH